MSEIIKIQVYEETPPPEDDEKAPPGKTPIADATVALLTREQSESGDKETSWPYYSVKPTHDHSKDGFYVAKSKDPLPLGEYLLVARTDKLTTVVQKLTLEAKKGVLVISAGWGKKRGAKHQAATVSIVNVGPRAEPTSDTPRFATINVALMELTQWVCMACHNHFKHDGTKYMPFARGRRNTLYAKGKINKGTLCSFIDCEARQTRVTVKSASPSRYSWVTIHEKDAENPLADDDGKERPKETAEHELGIEDFYDYVDSIGWIDPGSLVEAGIIGHGWVQGPIVWGTSDFSRGAERWAGGETDGYGTIPMDLDGRQDDFLRFGQRTPLGVFKGRALMEGYPMFRDAFRKDGSYHLFGCVHMNNVIAQCRTAEVHLGKGKARDEFFYVAISEGGRIHTTLDFVKRNVALNIVSELLGRPLEHGDCRGIATYPGAASQFLKPIKVMAAPPGMGSNYGRNGKDYINLVSGGGENAKPHKWLKAEFADAVEYDDLNYLNYTKMLDAELPDPGWRTERYVLMSDHDTDVLGNFKHAVLRLASGIEAMLPGDRVPRNTFNRPVAHKQDGHEGHLFVIRRTVAKGLLQRPNDRLVIMKTKKDNDCAFFVTTSGKTIYLEAPAGSKVEGFAIYTDELEVFKAEYKFRNDWVVNDPKPLALIKDGVIESVKPQFYW